MDMTVFESDKYDFDKELDFELMGIEIFNVNEADDPPPDILEKLEKHENKQTPNIGETEDVSLVAQFHCPVHSTKDVNL